MKIKKNRLNSLQTLAIGFALIILTGGFLLWLPCSNKVGLSFLDACFTATSATCVTGLVVCDTWTSFTLLGQIIIICLIQIGGLGFMMVSIFFSIIVRRRIGLRQRIFMGDSIGVWQVHGIVKMTKRVLLGVVIIESTGAVILATQFIPRFGALRGIWYGIFHSISAFCNAGFDLLGSIEPYCSLVPYQSNPVVILTIASLIIIGGIGFFVWNDIATNRFHFRHYHLHTKIMLTGTAALLIGGTALIYLFDHNGALKNDSVGVTWLSAFFQAVTARTAGFNSVDQAALSSGGALVTILLMFIGAGSGSTGGGVKVSTAFVLLLGIRARMQRKNSVNVFHRTLESDATGSAATQAINYLILAAIGSLIVCFQGFTIQQSFFEVFSALSTVGLTQGITRDLSILSRLIIIFLMYLGRVGSLSVAIALIVHKHPADVTYPTEKVIIG